MKNLTDLTLPATGSFTLKKNAEGAFECEIVLEDGFGFGCAGETIAQTMGRIAIVSCGKMNKRREIDETMADQLNKDS